MHKAEKEGACSALEGKLYLSLRDEIAEVLPELTMRRVPFSGAGALCAGEKSLFCADQSGAIWRLDRKTLMEQSLSCGGPGICDLCLSPCGTRLYALLSEADSVLLCDAQCARALVLNRCGCNPSSLSCTAELLAVAGGESGCVHLYDALTLECLAEMPMPGPVCSVLLHNGAVYALCMTADMNTLLAIRRGKDEIRLRLGGMPGCLCAAGDRILAATQGCLHVLTWDGRLLGMRAAPGRASRLCADRAAVYLYDPLSECIFLSRDGGPWRLLCSHACDICQC